jgi:hypothetical protein
MIWIGPYPLTFKVSWLKKVFSDLVAREWASIPMDINSMISWQNKIRHLWHYLRG